MKSRRWTHRWWIHEKIKQIKIYGVYYHLVQELKMDSERFHQYFRMTSEQFGDILVLQIEPLRAKGNRARKTIHAKATFCYRAYV